LHLSRAISRARRQQQILAVGMLDLDDFKPVNDRWGHAAGDALLRDFAQRIQQALRDTDFIGRLGGDEFVLVLENLTQQADLETVLSRLREVVQAPFDLPDGQRASVGLSLGLALYPQDAADADALIRAADAALYASKSNKSGRARWWLLYGELGQHPGQAPADAIWTEVASGAVPPYGPEAGRLLGLLQPQVGAFAAGFVQRFYADMARQPDMQAVLQTLSEPELAHLQQMQQTHLLSFFSADLEEASHREDARKLAACASSCGRRRKASRPCRNTTRLRSSLSGGRPKASLTASTSCAGCSTNSRICPAWWPQPLGVRMNKGAWWWNSPRRASRPM
ncbi:MAG: hypothetical protein B7X43_05320, partial [Thiomonas sp. 15-63-373]